MTTSVTPGRPYRGAPHWASTSSATSARTSSPATAARCSPEGQEAFVATPEKALLDLIYLEPDADTEEYLNELRLQHLETLDLGELHRLAEQFGKPKLLRAAGRVARMAEREALDYGPL